MKSIPGLNSPFLLGFERLEQMAAHIAKASGEGYPPHNVEQIGTHGLRITLAVAGFDLDDLDVAVVDSQLVVKGRRRDDDAGRVFLHRGIAARQFQRSWLLADGIEVKGASLDNGLLHIDLQRIEPPATARSIRINKGAGGVDGGSARTVTVGGER
jgi:HSP20 family molecular chaperone IbpA